MSSNQPLSVVKSASLRQRGKFHNSASRRKIAKAKQKRVRRIEDGKIFDSIGDAARSVGVSHSMVSMVCRGIRSHAHGWHFEFVDES